VPVLDWEPEADVVVVVWACAGSTARRPAMAKSATAEITKRFRLLVIVVDALMSFTSDTKSGRS